MHDFIAAIVASSTLSPTARKDKLTPLATTTALSTAVLHMIHNEGDARAISRALSDLAATKTYKDILNRQSTIHKEGFLSLLASPDAKLRKNMAELLGRIDPDGFSDALMQAFVQEEIDFVKPSILLALGNAENASAVLPFLQSITLPASTDKNILSQHAALQKSIAHLQPNKSIAAPQKLVAPEDLILSCPNANVTLQELQDFGYTCEVLDKNSNLLQVLDVEDYLPIYRSYTFYDAGLFMGSYTSIEAAIDDIVPTKILDAVQNLYGTATLAYRIDIVGEDVAQKERLVLYDTLPQKFASTALLNSPTNYDFEIRFHNLGKNILVGIYPGKRIDTRFAYRTQSISASVHPAVAASCLYSIKEYLYTDAAVLDPFCGAGTMLVERSRYPYASLTGSDLSRTAINAAKANAKEAKLKASLFTKDARLPFEQQFDEVICNMPFGLRVSDHKGNESLYTKFLDTLSNTLPKDGRAFLFTNEKKLLQELFSKNFICIDRITFSAGGLYPSMYVLRKKK